MDCKPFCCGYRRKKPQTIPHKLRQHTDFFEKRKNDTKTSYTTTKSVTDRNKSKAELIL